MLHRVRTSLGTLVRGASRRVSGEFYGLRHKTETEKYAFLHVETASSSSYASLRVLLNVRRVADLIKNGFNFQSRCIKYDAR